MLGSLVGEPVARPDLHAVAPSVPDARADAFRRLVEREFDGAYRLAAVILHDRLEAEDAVHDAALAAWRHFADLRDGSRFDAWFTRILVNSCRDRLRARARRRVVDLGRELVEAEHPWETDAGEATTNRDAFDRAVDALSPDERALIGLRYDADLTVPAIAGLLGVPVGTVKSRLHHALNRLRAAIEEAER